MYALTFFYFSSLFLISNSLNALVQVQCSIGILYVILSHLCQVTEYCGIIFIPGGQCLLVAKIFLVCRDVLSYIVNKY